MLRKQAFMNDIPTYDHAKRDSDGAPRPSFHYYAARMCLLAPIIGTIFVKSVIYGLKDTKTTWGLLIAAGLGFLLAVIYVVSLVLGFVGLTGSYRRGNEGALVRAVLGMIISGTLLGFWGVGFVRGYRMAMQNRKAAQAVAQAAKEIKQDMKKELAEKGTASPDASQAGAEKLKKAFDNASKQLTGDDALVAQAGAYYMARLQNVVNDYTAAAQAIKSPLVFMNMNGVDQREQLATRKATVNKFLEANEKMLSFITKAEIIFREELVRAKVSPAALETALKGYRQTADERNYLTIQIRMDDQRIGNAMLGMLDLLDSNWGNWKYNPDKKNVIFQDTDAVAKYNEYFKDMTAAGKEQAKLQSQLLSLPAVASAR